jgi:hypothetical protein
MGGAGQGIGDEGGTINHTDYLENFLEPLSGRFGSILA